MFKVDSRFWQLMTKIGDILLLSLLWFIFSLPLITLPLATVSAYGVINRQLAQPEISIVKNYLLLVRQNFKPVFLATCLLLPPLAIVILGVFCLGGLTSLLGQFLGIIILLLLLVSLVWLFYWLPLRGQTPEKLKISSFLWSFYLALRHLPWSLLLLVLFAGALWLTLQFLPVLFFSIGSFVYLNCLIVKKISSYSYQEMLTK